MCSKNKRRAEAAAELHLIMLSPHVSNMLLFFSLGENEIIKISFSIKSRNSINSTCLGAQISLINENKSKATKEGKVIDWGGNRWQLKFFCPFAKSGAKSPRISEDFFASSLKLSN